MSDEVAGEDEAAVEVDILIVGAGPTGLFGAYYAGFRGLRVAVMDSLSDVGGQLNALYPEKWIRDVAGFPSIKARDLVAGLVAQAAPFSPAYLLGHQALHLTHGEDGNLVVTSAQGLVVHARAMVITAGIGTFTPRPLPAGQEFEERGLRYFVPDPNELADRDVVIVGGGDSAFDWAQHLEPIARSVTLVHRRAIFRAHQHTVQQVMDSRVTVLTNSEITGIQGDLSGPKRDFCIEAVDVMHVPSSEVRNVKAQAVIAALGFTAQLGPLLDWGLDISERCITVDTRMQTNVPRVYAAGDITTYPGKVRLIAVGFGEVATAVNNAAAALDPGAPLFPGHSTEQLPDFPSH